MAIVLFDCRGMIYMHTVTPKITVTGAYCFSVLKTLMGHIRRKQPELVGRWMLHDMSVPDRMLQTLLFNFYN
jgi:hypothetical protein